MTEPGNRPPLELSPRARAIAPSPTMRVSGLARTLRAQGRDVVDLSVGEPDFPTPEAARVAAKNAIDAHRTRYTANAGIPELRRAIANKLATENGVEYDENQILVSPGAKASLFLAMLALLDDGDEAIVPAPYWVSYPEQVRIAGGIPVIVPTREEHGFRLTPADLDRVVTPRTRVLVLNYPSNPTGSCYDADELAALAEVARRHDLWIIADEIYERLVYDGFRFTSLSSLSEDARSRTLLINGLSKSYSMTGWRIGYAAGPPRLIQAMASIQSHDTSNATSISQWAGVSALTETEADVRMMVSEFEKRRNLLVERLAGIPGIRCGRPTGAFYLFPNVDAYLSGSGSEATNSSSEAVAMFLLERAEVAVVPGEAFGAPGHLRMSFATSEDRIRLAADRIAAAMSSIRA